MNIDHIEAGADGIAKPARSRTRLVFANDVLLENGSLCSEAARLAYIWIFRQAVFRSHDIGAKDQFGVTLALKVIARDVCLQPVEKCERDAFGLLEDADEVLRSAVQQ